MGKEYIRFLKVDENNRPIFKAVKAKRYYMDVFHTFPEGAKEKEVLAVVSAHELLFYGTSLAGEPLGSTPVYDLEIQPK